MFISEHSCSPPGEHLLPVGNSPSYQSAVCSEKQKNDRLLSLYQSIFVWYQACRNDYTFLF